jgi:hypothetical protein
LLDRLRTAAWLDDESLAVMMGLAWRACAAGSLTSFGTGKLKAALGGIMVRAP